MNLLIQHEYFNEVLGPDYNKREMEKDAMNPDESGPRGTYDGDSTWTQRRARSKTDWAGVSLGCAFDSSVDYYLRLEAQRRFYRLCQEAQRAAAKATAEAVWRWSPSRETWGTLRRMPDMVLDDAVVRGLRLLPVLPVLPCLFLTVCRGRLLSIKRT